MSEPLTAGVAAGSAGVTFAALFPESPEPSRNSKSLSRHWCTGCISNQRYITVADHVTSSFMEIR